jgi:hypothetical protein
MPPIVTRALELAEQLLERLDRLIGLLERLEKRHDGAAR